MEKKRKNEEHHREWETAERIKKIREKGKEGERLKKKSRKKKESKETNNEFVDNGKN